MHPDPYRIWLWWLLYKLINSRWPLSSVFITNENLPFHWYLIPMMTYACPWCNFPFFYLPCLLWQDNPVLRALCRNPFHSGDQDRGLEFHSSFTAQTFGESFLYLLMLIHHYRSHLWSSIMTIDAHISTNHSPTTAPNLKNPQRWLAMSCCFPTQPHSRHFSIFLPSLADTESACSHPSRLDLVSF